MTGAELEGARAAGDGTGAAEGDQAADARRELGLWLENWDGQLNAATLELVSRHSEHCVICGRRQGGTLRSAALGRLLPLPALPPGLREQVLERCAGDPGAAGGARGQASASAGSGASQPACFPQTRS